MISTTGAIKRPGDISGRIRPGAAAAGAAPGATESRATAAVRPRDNGFPHTGRPDTGSAGGEDDGFPDGSARDDALHDSREQDAWDRAGADRDPQHPEQTPAAVAVARVPGVAASRPSVAAPPRRVGDQDHEYPGDEYPAADRPNDDRPDEGHAGDPGTVPRPVGDGVYTAAAAGRPAGEGDGTGTPADLRRRRRTRMVALAAATLVVLGALPLFFGIRAASRDPVFTSLDALSVPAWASSAAEDSSSGSRWCFIECRFRERTAQSAQPFAATAQTYETALTGAGWQPWKVSQCPEQPVDGVYSCWRRDEFTLDLWVRKPACAVDAVAAQDPAVVPSAGPDGSAAPPDPSTCTGSTVTIKVQNAITDVRGQPQPQPTLGETPDAVPGDDPLLEATPTPS